MMDDEQVSYDRRHGCVHCGSLTFSNEYFKAFKVKLPVRCPKNLSASTYTSGNHRCVHYVQVLICNSCKQQEDLIAKV